MNKDIKTDNQLPEDELKRNFLKKFGNLVAVAPIGMFILMGPGASRANASSIDDDDTSNENGPKGSAKATTATPSEKR